MLITQDDLQRIGDEDTLLHFLEEKMNLPIPEGLPLEDITIKFGKLALGLSGVVASQVLDCQELSVSLGESSGIILIRFNSKSGYVEALRAVAAGLDRSRHNPASLRFICMDEHFQPFALAYFNDSESKDCLNIRAWTQENTYIHTSWEHELPTNFFGKESTDELEDKTEINEFNVTASLSSPDLSAKLEAIGTQLGTLEHIHSGITTGYDRALLIDERTRKHLLAEDPNSRELIKRSPRISRKWICEPKYLIGILSSHIKQWPWSHISSESAAERIFEKEYPAIHAHLSRHTNGLKKRSKTVQGKFYWEMSNKRLEPTPKRSEIIYPQYPTSMQAVYDSSEGIPTSSFHLIPTTDLSLLAIFKQQLLPMVCKNQLFKVNK